ncbi:MAG: ABC transporter substrate-binding protein [Rickettsiales bacterium]|jgi:polar amino acid transport system substrate-binding protein|nr:ABC transporter substrate-binding protein [Rickettsiales bacterium]
MKVIGFFLLLFTSASALVVGIDSTRIPFAYYDKEQKLSGFDIDFFKEYEIEYKESVEYVSMEFSGLLPALLTDKIDIIGTAITVTDERSEKVLFSDIVYKSKLSFLGKDNISNAILKDSSIGVIIGTPNADYLNKNGYGNIVYYNSIDVLYKALEFDKVKYLFHNNVTNEYYIKKHNGYKICGDSVKNGVSSYSVKKNNTDLKNKIDRLIEVLEKKGTLQKMKDKYQL